MTIITVKTGGITADAITSTKIADNAVVTAAINADAITAAKIADNAVVTAAINADAVTDAKIADDVVGTEHLTANEVDTAALAADAVTAAQIADDAISEEHLDVTSVTGHTAETSVADGDLVVIHDASASALRKMTVANLVANAGGGKIGQVIQTVKTNTASHNAQSFTDVSNMSVAITPSASNSKILVIVDARMGLTTNYSAAGRIVRGSTAIYIGDSAGNRTQGFTGPNSDENRDIHNFVATFLDSPNTTSETTYKLQTLTQDSSATIDINRTINDTNNNYDGRFASSITVMEVLA